jgi:molybdopterin-guanine dinucleotide biosynthesis protein A
MILAHDIEGAILAGGKSSRMGQDKGFVKLDGKPMISYSIDLLQRLNIPSRIVSHIEAYKQFGCEVIKDTIQEKGPMGGLYTALLHCEAKQLLLLSCDAPLISQELLSNLLGVSDCKKISVTYFRNKIYPLCAVYPKSILKVVKSYLEKDNLKMKTLIKNLPHQKVCMDKILEGKTYALSNFNTKSDIANYYSIKNHGS